MSTPPRLGAGDESPGAQRGASEGLRRADAGKERSGAKTQKPPAGVNQPRVFYPGNDLLSHPVAQAVPSALEGLTAVFEMGTGVSPPLWSPGMGPRAQRWQPGTGLRGKNGVKPHDRLVPLS